MCVEVSVSLQSDLERMVNIAKEVDVIFVISYNTAVNQPKEDEE